MKKNAIFPKRLELPCNSINLIADSYHLRPLLYFLPILSSFSDLLFFFSLFLFSFFHTLPCLLLTLSRCSSLFLPISFIRVVYHCWILFLSSVVVVVAVMFFMRHIQFPQYYMYQLSVVRTRVCWPIRLYCADLCGNWISLIWSLDPFGTVDTIRFVCLLC